MNLCARYVFCLVLVSCLINTLLAFWGQEDLSTYLVIDLIGFLVLTFIFTPANPKTKKTFNALNMIFFAGFLIMVIIEFTDMISRR